MMCIQKDEDLIEVNFSKKKIEILSLIRNKYAVEASTNILHHIFERSQIKMKFLGFLQDTVPSNGVQAKDYSPQTAVISPFPTWVPTQGRCFQGQVGLEHYHHKRRQHPSPEL